MRIPMCFECGNGFQTMDIHRKQCPYCKNYFLTPSMPGYHCCTDCAIKRKICQICGKKIGEDNND